MIKDKLQDFVELLAVGVSLEGEFDPEETLHAWEALKYACGYPPIDPGAYEALGRLSRELIKRECLMRLDGNLEDLPHGAWFAGCMGNFALMMEQTMKVS